jgi:hypothetical protein
MRETVYLKQQKLPLPMTPSLASSDRRHMHIAHQHNNNPPSSHLSPSPTPQPQLSSSSSPLHQQKVQSSIPQHQKYTTNQPQTSHIVPKRQHIEPETAQNRTPRDLDVEAVFLVHKRQVAHLVDDQAFEAEVEDGELRIRKRVSNLLQGFVFARKWDTE